MDAYTLKAYVSSKTEIENLKMRMKRLEFELRGMSIKSPSFEKMEGSNPNPNNRGINSRMIKLAERCNTIESLIKARRALLEEANNFFEFCETSDGVAFKMRYLEGFSFNTIERETGVSKRVFYRRLDYWLDQYNSKLVYEV
ncbi:MULTISPECIES: hypothetical protein [Erysipelothrix]|uniref:hypothetical protein n=1 Tax=Erysipelothrix TaxID=1647 RepID=UPI001408F105|nr:MULTISPECIES: hypothetical protein [Erysipelothrix]MDV7678443.1 hypothetical protein [Erysipelothrix rhusiopathiae]WMT70143.1 hypothetical protein K0H77_01135 [Erysipelothrix rhusiopathiae]